MEIKQLKACYQNCKHMSIVQHSWPINRLDANFPIFPARKLLTMHKREGPIRVAYIMPLFKMVH